MSELRIRVEGGCVRVAAPYFDANFNKKAKAELGATFDGATKEWVFDARDEEAARNLCYWAYGEDGREPTTETVDIRLTLTQSSFGTDRCDGARFAAFGRVVAERRARDSAVRLGKGVSVHAGRFEPTGGSMRFPAITLKTDTVVLNVRDIPKGHADLEVWADEIEVVSSSGPDRAALESEKATLVARLAEIDALLGESATTGD